MIGRRAIASLSLLCALVFCAFAAQGASAATTGTTVFECSKEAKVKDFTDAHCDNTGEGEYGHKPTTKTAFLVTNDKTKGTTTESTPSVLEGEVALTKTKITCTKLSGSGELTNELAVEVHKAKGKVKTEFSGCTVEKPLKCVVKEPIVANSLGETVTNIGGTNMGLQLSPESEGIFATIEYLNKGAEACGLNKQKFTVEGTAIGTGSAGSTTATPESGGTVIFGTDSKLTLGGKPATFTATATNSVSGNALTLTTPPYHL